MVKEAESFKEEDERQKAKVEARNGFENYVYQIKNTLNGEMKDKFTEDDRSTLDELVQSNIQWIESGDHLKEEYEAKQKEVEQVYFPIIQKVYGSGPPGSDGASSQPGPNVEEID
jgi:L1 cell adhesion molecule like protein